MKINVEHTLPDKPDCTLCNERQVGYEGDVFCMLFGDILNNYTNQPCPACISAREQARNVKEGSDENRTV